RTNCSDGIACRHDSCKLTSKDGDRCFLKTDEINDHEKLDHSFYCSSWCKCCVFWGIKYLPIRKKKVHQKEYENYSIHFETFFLIILLDLSLETELQRLRDSCAQLMDEMTHCA